MSQDPSRPSLRLVGGAESKAWALRVRAERDVTAENRAAATTASGLDPTDPRWVIAAHTRAQLQGTLLTPDRRRRVLDRARQLGLRSFEANVIMALVQDQARHGVPLGDVEATLAMLPDPRTRRPTIGWAHIVSALACAIVAALFLIRWVGAGSQ